MSESGKEEKSRKSGPGAVQHDARGNAVWQWAVDTGKHALDSTSALLRRLDLPGLSIEGDKSRKRDAESKAQQPGLEERGGYDPYGRSASKGPSRPPAAAARAASANPVSPPGPKPESRRSSWWRRLLGRR
jgi:hypothetical protein